MAQIPRPWVIAFKRKCMTNTPKMVLALAIMASLSPCAALAQSTGASSAGASLGLEGATDPVVQLGQIDARNQRKDGLFKSPIQPFRDNVLAWKESIYDAANLRLGFAFHTVFQYADDVQPGFDDSGVASDLDILGTWELWNIGQPTQGELVFGIEGRWNYGTTGPQTIGLASIGAAGGSANSFEEYVDPTFILRNLYWRQGSIEAGWGYRLGKITIDALLATNRHINPNGTFLSNAGTGLFVNGYADSGLGAAGVLYFGQGRGYVGATIADANGARDDFGDVSEGDFYKAVELAYKILPKSENAGYSKLTVWHTDGTADGTLSNGNTGLDGWGWSVVHEHEFSNDGNIVGVGRWGTSYDDAAVFENQGALALLFYEPTGWFDSDVVGFQYNYIDPVGDDARIEQSFEAFYRFPLLSDLDVTFAYQHINDPGNTRLVDSSNVFSVRVVTSF